MHTYPVYVSYAIEVLISVVYDVFGQNNSDVKDYWIDSLNDVKNGKINWATNPVGYFLKGVKGKRGKRINGLEFTSEQVTVAQFRLSLEKGQTIDAEKQWRSAFSENALTEYFTSFARKDSQYGSRGGRIAAATANGNKKLMEEVRKADKAGYLKALDKSAVDGLATLIKEKLSRIAPKTQEEKAPATKPTGVIAR